MSKRQILFLVCVIWFFAWIPVAWIWGGQPVAWADKMVFGGGDPFTIENARRTFPIHLASFTTSPVTQHSSQIENEDTNPLPEFDPWDWAFRETRYRWGLCFLLYLVTTICMRWFLSEIVMGKSRWED